MITVMTSDIESTNFCIFPIAIVLQKENQPKIGATCESTFRAETAQLEPPETRTNGRWMSKVKLEPSPR